MTLDYKLEYGWATTTSDDAVYVHLRTDPNAYYRYQTGKEAYAELDTEDQDALANGLFSVAGIEEIAVTAYRIWYMKSPAYQWNEVNQGALEFLATFFGEQALNQLQGSANINGSGLRTDPSTLRSTKRPTS